MRRSVFIIAAMMMLVLIAVPCFGWGREGHRIAGAIAWHYLTDKTKAAVQELLGGESLAAAGNWADEIRSDKQYDWAKPLHYVNVPRDATTVDPGRDCKNDECVVSAIDRFAKVLRDPKAATPERIEALKFLVHFVEDVHQPLHVSFAQDRGGNSIQITCFGKNDNLHRVWDTTLIDQRLGNEDWIALATKIRGGITEAQIKQWQEGSMKAVDWANESLTITQRLYLELPKDGVLGPEYLDRNIGTVEDRLAAAGVRLAVLLNSIFDSADGPETTEPPATTDASAFIKIVNGESCGNADGMAVYLVNTHESMPIRVKVRKVWTVNKKEMSSEQTYMVRPGDAARRQLGCSSQRVSGGEVRAFEWTIVEAKLEER